MIRRLLIPVLSFALAAGPAVSACAPDVVDLRGDWGQARFSVEIADEPAERSQGLMFRESMARNAGMLFVYEQPQRAVFWMKNTLIPLDMIFLDDAGVVTRIHENAVPHDTTGIDGGEGVRFVLEINGGWARRLGISEGSEMRHPSIGDEAAWTCEE